MIIDVHCHYTFSRRRAALQERFSFEPCPEGAHGAFPTDFDSCISPRVLRRLSWRMARWFLGYPHAGAALDERLEETYRAHFFHRGPIERFVLLAFDAAHDDAGRCRPLPKAGRDFGSDIYTSNSLVREMCRLAPDRFLFGASVHPYRPNAIACIEEVFAAGACLLKWLPLHQNIDVSDPRTIAALRRCAELGLPVLVHYGPEFTLQTHRPTQRSVLPLLESLRTLSRAGRMPCTIVAHAATPVTPLVGLASHRALVAALAGEFAEAPLYADLAALGTWVKTGYLRALLRRADLHHKLLFGTDFPVPPLLHRLRRELGCAYEPIARVPSWPQRTALAYRALGFDEIVFHRAATLLPHVEHFRAASQHR